MPTTSGNPRGLLIASCGGLALLAWIVLRVLTRLLQPPAADWMLVIALIVIGLGLGIDEIDRDEPDAR